MAEEPSQPTSQRPAPERVPPFPPVYDVIKKEHNPTGLQKRERQP